MIYILVISGRYWEMVERLKINQFYAAPTALRLLLKAGKYLFSKSLVMSRLTSLLDSNAMNGQNETKFVRLSLY